MEEQAQNYWWTYRDRFSKVVSLLEKAGSNQVSSKYPQHPTFPWISGISPCQTQISYSWRPAWADGGAASLEPADPVHQSGAVRFSTTQVGWALSLGTLRLSCLSGIFRAKQPPPRSTVRHKRWGSSFTHVLSWLTWVSNAVKVLPHIFLVDQRVVAHTTHRGLWASGQTTVFFTRRRKHAASLCFQVSLHPNYFSLLKSKQSIEAHWWPSHFNLKWF